jgi:DNA helicase HerA-like ATPase
MTVAIEIGRTATGEPASLDLEELLATRLLVQGNSGSGKSHLLRRLLEQSVPWVQQAVIDSEGDFATLAAQYGHLVIDAEEHTERGLQVAAERARIHPVSTILNLEGLDVENQMSSRRCFSWRLVRYCAGSLVSDAGGCR